MTNNLVKKTPKRVMGVIYHVPAHTQWCIAQVIKKLFKCKDWVKHDQKVVQLGDFEVCVALWLLKVGVRGLVLARVQQPNGRRAVEIALACEEEWLLGNNSEEEEAELHGFAADLLLWGHDVEAMGAERDKNN